MSPDSGEFSSSSQSIISGDAEAINHLKQAVANGKHWFIALLEAMGLWSSPEEDYNGRIHRYLIDGEAFDWLSLAERLCLEIDGLIPEEEKVALLFAGKSPIPLTKEEFKNLIGVVKYRAYLNFLYGVVVEEALHLAVEEEVRKDWGTHIFCREKGIHDEVYWRIYGSNVASLLSQFRTIKGYLQRVPLSLNERKEFTYWLFKFRLKQCDKARVASDTKKALAQLACHRRERNFPPNQLDEEIPQIVELTSESYST